VANDKVTEQDLDFRFLRAPIKSERQADQLLLSEQDKLLRSAFSLRSETTKNSFKALGLYPPNIDDDFDSYNSNKAETKRANGINDIITINNINYLTLQRLSNYQFNKFGTCSFLQSKSITALQRLLPLSIKECVGRSAYLRIVIKSALAVIKHFCLCRARAHDFI